MPRFRYLGTDEKGTSQEGTHESAHLLEAAKELKTEGLSLTRLSADPAGEKTDHPLETFDAFVLFNRALAEMTSVGIPLTEAIRRISKGLGRGKFKRAIQALENRLADGASLEKALQETMDKEGEGAFPRYYPLIVRAGIASGNLPGTLHAVAQNAEIVSRLKALIWQVLAYPLLLILIAACLVGFFVLEILSPYLRLFESMSIPIPHSLTALSFFGSALGRPLLLGAGFVAVALVFKLFLLNTPVGEHCLLHIPFIGRIARNLRQLRFLNCLGMLLDTRVPLEKAIAVSACASGSPLLEAAGPSLEKELEEGKTLAGTLGKHPLLRGAVASYLRTGEQGGRLEPSVHELRELKVEETENLCKGLGILLDPIVIFVTGIVLAGVLSSLWTPYLYLIHGLSE